MRFARPEPVRVRVHERGDRRLDGILRLVEEAAQDRPLAEILAASAASIAEIAQVDVASIYVHEGDELIMRGNVGFPPGVVDVVRLRTGEGLTGFVAECLRPVSVGAASLDARYKHVPGIGEEKFPSYLGIPLVSGGRALGVLVLQRRHTREFPPAEVALAAALAAPVAYALERAERRLAEPVADLRSRAALLEGKTVVEGTALGRAALLPAGGGTGAKQPTEVALAFSSLARELSRAARKIAAALGAEEQVRLRALTVILDDDRFRDLMVTSCAARGVEVGLRELVRDYARAPYRVRAHDADGASWMAERAEEIESLCLLVGARAAGRRVPETGDLVVLERLSAMAALATIARRGVGVVTSGEILSTSLGAALCAAARLPVTSNVSGLFAWVRPGDRVLIEEGRLSVNPPATVIARVRGQRALAPPPTDGGDR
jgi:phosphotransferase system enzyme I (PtsP)